MSKYTSVILFISGMEDENERIKEVKHLKTLSGEGAFYKMSTETQTSSRDQYIAAHTTILVLKVF